MATITSHSPEETIAAGRTLANEIPAAGAILGLVGGLGAGKTQLVKGLAEGLGCDDEPTSPTFTIVHEYRGGRVPLVHLDLYRIESAEELLALGFDEYAVPGAIVAIEWADKFREVMPEETRWVEFKILPGEEREIRIT